MVGMNLYRNESMSIADYFKIREKSEHFIEYIDGFIYISPSPSTNHQRISSKLYIKLGNFL
jgi:Uma2 family endonuclease